jgi:hypothetical protein
MFPFARSNFLGCSFANMPIGLGLTMALRFLLSHEYFEQFHELPQM